MKKIQVVILAAGHGKRMNRNDTPKAMVELSGRPMIDYTLKTVADSGVDDKPVIVIGKMREQIRKHLGSSYTYIVQKKQLGTGHAVSCTKRKLQRKVDNIMVLYADNPLVTPKTIQKLAKTHLKDAVALTMAVVKVSNFNDWRRSFYSFGRIIRDSKGKILKSIEVKDATLEQRKIREVNPSIYCFNASWLWKNLEKLKNTNIQGEFYLTDLLELVINQKKSIETIRINTKEAIGVNTEDQLADAESLLTPTL